MRFGCCAECRSLAGCNQWRRPGGTLPPHSHCIAHAGVVTHGTTTVASQAMGVAHEAIHDGGRGKRDGRFTGLRTHGPQSKLAPYRAITWEGPARWYLRRAPLTTTQPNEAGRNVEGRGGAGRGGEGQGEACPGPAPTDKATRDCWVDIGQGIGTRCKLSRPG
jgi:hypothetical protein